MVGICIGLEKNLEEGGIAAERALTCKVSEHQTEKYWERGIRRDLYT